MKKCVTKNKRKYHVSEYASTAIEIYISYPTNKQRYSRISLHNIITLIPYHCELIPIPQYPLYNIEAPKLLDMDNQIYNIFLEVRFIPLFLQCIINVSDSDHKKNNASAAS